MRLAEIGNCQIHELYRFWQSRRRADGRPMAREALDPADLGPLLSNIMLLEVEEPKEEGKLPLMRFRVAGDEIESRYGRSLRGSLLHETFPLVRRSDTSHQWSEILRDKKPKYRRGPMRFPDDQVFEAECLLLPLSMGDRDVAFILGAIFYLAVGSNGEKKATWAGDITE